MRLLLALVLALASSTPAFSADSFSIGSENAVLQAIESAQSVFVTAYVLPEDNYVARALRGACLRGTHVTLLLADPGYDPSIAATNRTTLQSFASMSPSSSCRVGLATRPLHLKVVLTDHTVWLSDTNFSATGYVLGTTDGAVRDAISKTLADDQPHQSNSFATGKAAALALEARVLQSGTQPLCISTESLSARTPLATVFFAAIRRRQPIFLAVSPTEFRSNPQERAFVAEMAGFARSTGAPFHFVLNDRNEKFAIAGNDLAWVGSSNATSIEGMYGSQLDWGLLTTSTAVRSMVAARCAVLFSDK